jgi:hypothetical protein
MSKINDDDILNAQIKEQQYIKVGSARLATILIPSSLAVAFSIVCKYLKLRSFKNQLALLFY